MCEKHREASEVMCASSSVLLGPSPVPQKELDFLKNETAKQEASGPGGGADKTSKLLHWPRKPSEHAAWALERKTCAVGSSAAPLLTMLL